MWVPVMRAKMLVLLQLRIRCVYSAIKIMQRQPKSLCLKKHLKTAWINVSARLHTSSRNFDYEPGLFRQCKWSAVRMKKTLCCTNLNHRMATREEKEDFRNSKISKRIISIRVYTLSFWTKLTESYVTSRRECRIMNCLSPEFFPLKHCGFHLYQVVTSIERSVVTLHLVLTACLHCSPPEQSHRAEPLK